MSVASILKVVAFATLVLLLVAEVEARNFIVGNNSFKIRSSIHRVNGEGKQVSVPVTEYYSASQKRARIDYTIKDSFQFYFDAKSTNCLICSNNKCISHMKYDLEIDLFGSDYKQMGGVLNMIDSHGGHLVGTVELLYFIIGKANNLQPKEKDANDDELEVDLVLKTDKHGLVNVAVFYQHQDENLIQANDKIRIRFYFQETSKTVEIIYFDCQLLNGYHLESEYDLVARGMSAEVSHDIFSFPLASSTGLQTISIDNYQRTSNSDLQFSFTAKVHQRANDKSLRIFVAHDGVTERIRVDTEQTSNFQDISSHDTTRLFDFHLNRKYFYPSKLDVKSRTNQCYVHPIGQLVDQYTHISRFIFGGDKFVNMGRAKVRGIDATMYEIADCNFPYIFDDPLVYEDLHTNHKYRYNNANGLNDEEPSRARVVVYIAVSTNKNSSTLVRPKDEPLLIEVYEKKADGESPALQIEVHNFQWKLVEAPNGQRPNELFLLQDSCSNPEDGSKHSELELLLKVMFEDKYDEKKHGWLDNWYRRNTAIMNSTLR